MRHVAVLSVVVLTTLAALRWAHHLGRLSRARLRSAAATMLEYVGLTMVFLVLNVLLGTVGVLALRAVTGYFISVYVMNDLVLVLLSLLQALALGPLLLPGVSARD